jgi:hypothetical protein
MSKPRAQHKAGRAVCLKLVSCLAYAMTLKVEVKYSSEISVHVHQTTQHYIPKDRNLHNHCCTNFESNIREHVVNGNLIDYLLPSLL